MGKKKITSTAAPIFPFPAAATEDEAQHHFSDYGFDPQLSFFQSVDVAKRPARRHHQPPPLDSARFTLQKPISKINKQKHHRRRRWWSSAASAALLFFKRPSNNTTSSSSSRSNVASAALYLADADADAGFEGCACWAPAIRSGKLAASECAASQVVPYVSLRNVNLGSGGGGGDETPTMPIYLVT